MKTAVTLLLLTLAAHPVVAAPVTGPVIEDYGPVYYTPEQPLDLPPYVRLKAVFDVSAASEESGKLNYRLETVARYLNMHARAGVDQRRLQTVVVLHGQATRPLSQVLAETAYEQRYGELHPDAELLRQLVAAGVRLVVCGQSAAALGFRREEFAPDVQMSLSALTALVTLQSDGYALIPWGTD